MASDEPTLETLTISGPRGEPVYDKRNVFDRKIREDLCSFVIGTILSLRQVESAEIRVGGILIATIIEARVEKIVYLKSNEEKYYLQIDAQIVRKAVEQDYMLSLEILLGPFSAQVYQQMKMKKANTGFRERYLVESIAWLHEEFGVYRIELVDVSLSLGMLALYLSNLRGNNLMKRKSRPSTVAPLRDLTTNELAKKENTRPLYDRNVRSRQDANKTPQHHDTLLAAIHSKYPNAYVKHVAADGNCMFRCLAYHIYRDDSWHSEVRSNIVQYMCQHPKDFQFFLENPPGLESDTALEVHLNDLKLDAVWGGHLELQAAANLYGSEICIYSLSKQRTLVQNKVVPKGNTARQWNVALYHPDSEGAHYNVLIL